MVDKQLIEDTTYIYLYSYSVAFNETHNPNLAVQCALGVTTVLANKVKVQTNPMELLVAMIARMAQDTNGSSKPHTKREKKDDSEKDT